MTGKFQTSVSGRPSDKGRPDGVSGAPRGDVENNIHGRTNGGESGGGAYPNPHSGKTSTNTGFMAHGGQTDIAYHGGGQAGEGSGSAPNGVTGSRGDAGMTIAADPDADRTPHKLASTERAIAVVETSGTAQAEAVGKTGTDARYEDEQEFPDSR